MFTKVKTTLLNPNEPSLCSFSLGWPWVASESGRFRVGALTLHLRLACLGLAAAQGCGATLSLPPGVDVA